MTGSMRVGWPNCCAAIMLSPVYHGEHGVRTPEGTGAELSDDQQRSRIRVMSTGEGDLSQLGDSL